MGYYDRLDRAREIAEETGMEVEEAYEREYGHEYPSMPDEADIILGLYREDDDYGAIVELEADQEEQEEEEEPISF